jgi:hypothetical protein
MDNSLRRLKVTIEPEWNTYRDGTNHSKINITVSRFGKEDVHIQRLVPNDDFESYWDYVWKNCKLLLDQELKRTDGVKEII